MRWFGRLGRIWRACYKEFVCVENASCTEPVTVAAQATWAGEHQVGINSHTSI